MHETRSSAHQSRPREVTRQWPQVLAVVVCGILVIGNGLQFSWPSPAIPKLLAGELTFNVTRTQVSYIVMVSPLSYILGGPICTLLLDKIGRKYTITSLALPQIVSWVLIATATNVYMIYVSRIASGIAEAGVFTAVPVYICEISEPKIRGAMGLYFSVALAFGFLLINIYGSYMPLRLSAYVSLSLPILFLVTAVWMPESPYFLIMKEESEGARQSLRTLRRINNVDSEFRRLSRDISRQISEPGNLRDLFVIRTNMRSLYIVIALRTIQQLNGGATIIFYNQLIFLEAQGIFSHTESAVIHYSIMVLMTGVASILIDRFGRKPLLIFSILTTSVCLFVEGLYFAFKKYDYDVSSIRWIPIVGIVMYAVFRSIGLVGIPTAVTGEMFSASVKSKAAGIATIFFGLMMSFCSKLFEVLTEAYGMHVPFFIFTICSLFGAVFCWYFMPETKGITLEEIQQRLSI